MTAPANHARFEWTRMCTVWPHVELPEDVAETPAGDYERQENPDESLAGHPAKRSCTRLSAAIDVGDVVVRVRRRQRQREHLVAGALRHRQRRLARRTARGTQVSLCTGRKWIDVRDVLLGERALVLVACRAAAIGVDPHDVEVQRVHVAVVTCERRDARQPGHRLVVERELALP